VYRIHEALNSVDSSEALNSVDSSEALNSVNSSSVILFLCLLYLKRRGAPCRGFVGKPEGKRPPEKTRRRWDYNIKMNITKSCENVDYINLAQKKDT
jgi:hypothetical protein